jgi:hypothetical protein
MQLNPDLKAILFNILGGIIVTVLAWIIMKLSHHFNAVRFKRVFGKQSINETKLVYGKMVLLPSYDENGIVRTFPYSKPGSAGGYRVTSILADTEAISIKYLSDSFSKNTKESPSLTSDENISDKIDISYLAFGGLNNTKSIEVGTVAQFVRNNHIDFIEQQSDQELDHLFGENLLPEPNDRYKTLEPYFPKMEKELKKRGITRHILWERYIATHPDGYKASQFKYHYQQWLKRSKPVMHIEHIAGDKMFIDYADQWFFYISKKTFFVFAFINYKF